MPVPLQPVPRPGILDIPPYRLGESAVPGMGRVIQLASNECAADPSPRALEAYRDYASSLRRYPDASGAPLRQALARAHGLDPERIVCGNGSEELIGLLARGYAGPGDEVVVAQYGYQLFPLAARIAGARVVTAPAAGLKPDIDALLAALTPRTRLLFLANPNNPTGALLAQDEIERLHKGLPRDVLLVLDAAYAEYVGRADYEPGLRLAAAAPNVAVLRSFSKAHGLAGLRIGWLYGASAVAAVLHRIRAPTNVSGAGQAAAVAALRDAAHLARVVALNRGNRSRFLASLERQGLQAAPSEGNFVLVRFTAAGAAAAAYAFLRAQGILARPMDAYGLDAWLRFTIGTAEEMDMVADALAEHLR